jgi:hypothetical protein
MREDQEESYATSPQLYRRIIALLVWALTLTILSRSAKVAQQRIWLLSTLRLKPRNPFRGLLSAGGLNRFSNVIHEYYRFS